ncbi:MAG: hypothetical protein OXP09_04630 [Gammaproteobacteria bacterium]|nr:hypothetical protein [Gammaproteobacteria bacterium]
MKRQLTYTIIADGGSDRILVPIIQWAIHRLDPVVEIIEPEFEKRIGGIEAFFEAYEFSTMLVFAHRDSENQSLVERAREFEGLNLNRVVPVIPVRMSEAWLLIDGRAIAEAAGSPSTMVQVPKLSQIEQIANPKELLDQHLFEAAGSPAGRQGKKFKRSKVERRINVASCISDYSPLESLSGFVQFQKCLAEAYPYPLTT